MLNALAARPTEVIVDLTLGGGGHAKLLLEAGAAQRLYLGLDRDLQAVQAATERLAEFGDRVVVVHSAASDVLSVLEERGIESVDGLLADLGVSSHQLDTPERGFSFRGAGPLDMRMDSSSGVSLDEWLKATSEEEIGRVIREYGEVPGSWRMARAITEAHGAGKLTNTAALAAVIERAAPPALKKKQIHPATQAFQALRIAVNDELGELEAILEAVPGLLAQGGRAAIISFHSLEDRLVKRAFRALSGRAPRTRLPIPEDPTAVKFKELRPSPKVASESEIQRNPRARSAKLRVLERRAA